MAHPRSNRVLQMHQTSLYWAQQGQIPKQIKIGEQTIVARLSTVPKIAQLGMRTTKVPENEDDRMSTTRVRSQGVLETEDAWSRSFSRASKFGHRRPRFLGR